MNTILYFLKFICILVITLDILISLIYLNMAQDVIKINKINFKGSSLSNIAKYLLLISAIINLILLIIFIIQTNLNNFELVIFFASTFILAFQIPITVTYWTKIKNGENCSVGFKVLNLYLQILYQAF